MYFFRDKSQLANMRLGIDHYDIPTFTMYNWLLRRCSSRPESARECVIIYRSLIYKWYQGYPWLHRWLLRMCSSRLESAREYNIIYVDYWSIYDIRDTGWRRPIGCLKLQVIFRKRANNHRTLLRKMTYKDKASYGSSPPDIPDYTADFWKFLPAHEFLQKILSWGFVPPHKTIPLIFWELRMTKSLTFEN